MDIGWATWLARGELVKKPAAKPPSLTEPELWAAYLCRGAPLPPANATAASSLLPGASEKKSTASSSSSSSSSSSAARGSGIFATTGHPRPSAPPPSRPAVATSAATEPPPPPTPTPTSESETAPPVPPASSSSSSSSSSPPTSSTPAAPPPIPLSSSLSCGTAGGSAKVFILWSSISTDSNTTRMEDMFAAKKLVHEKYDGSWPDYLELRDRLFAVSGRKGKYPQCFISRGSKGNEKFEFVGMWEDIENLADMDTIPADFLASHPEIKTFSRVFADVQRTASN